MATEKYSISVKTGVELVSLTDELGRKIGEFPINLSDFGIVKRSETAIDETNALVSTMNNEAGAESDQAAIDEVTRFGDEIVGIIERLIGIEGAADGIFAHCSPMTLDGDGNFFYENVLEGIFGLVEKVFGERMQKKIKKIQKATSKYHK